MRVKDGHPQHYLRAGMKAALIGLVLLVTGAGGLFAASHSTKPGITVQVSPASQSVQQGQSASYTVSLTSTGGFNGTVGLSVSGLPSGATGTFSPSSVPLGSGSTATAILNVANAATTPAGTKPLTITGSSGKVSGSVTAVFIVNHKMSSGISVAAAPGSVSIPPGATAVYTLGLTRNNFSGPVSFQVLGGLPSGAAASFSPHPVTGTSTTLQVTTSAASPTGGYNLSLIGTWNDAAGKSQYAYANVRLVVDSAVKQFVLSGSTLDPLSPGSSASLDLKVDNTNNKALSLTNISVAVAGVARSADAPANLSCTPSDFAVTQYSGPYPLQVPAGTNKSLQELGAADSALPRVAMLDSTANQDGCKGATLQLTYSGSGQGN